MTLPIDAALPDLIAALKSHGRAVLQAPPGAGKTTRVPLALMQAGTNAGKIIMLEPRRIAARAAAERLAEQLGEKTGQSVGYLMRGDSKSGSKIEVVTEGILTRMLQSDPELTGIGTVIFDEFHERSLNADLGLALTWEIIQALRDDLHLVVMSATLDAAPVAAMLDDAPIITSQGRAYPVDIQHLDCPVDKSVRFETAAADLVAQAVKSTTGGVLVFLPGEGEIRRIEAALTGRLPGDIDIRPLFGAMPFDKQRAAIAPVKTGRKVVLSTSIAETSLTIEDIRVVVDCGRARRSRYDPSSGMSRLVTERVTKAEATQRTGRAGRVAEGTCFRMWTKGEEGSMAAFPPAEIEAADLAGLALELAVWGSSDLPFLTPPPEGTLAEARALLTQLGALDHAGLITPHGSDIAKMPVHPRLAHMMVVAGKQAAPLAALLADRDPLMGVSTDLTLRMRAIQNGDPRANRGALDRIRAEAKRLAKNASDKPTLSWAEMAALAYPDRIGLRRKGDAPRFILSGGKGAIMPDGDALAGQRLIIATDLDGNPREAKVRQAIAISDSELRGLFADQIEWMDVCEWSKRDRRVLTRKQERFGALVLDDRNNGDADPHDIAVAMLDGVRDLGLRLSGAAARFRARVELVRDGSDRLPAMDDESLMQTIDQWLLPHLDGVRNAEDWKKFDPLNALRGMLDWEQLQLLDRSAPAHFETPLGRKLPIDYDGDLPQITVRVQEMFGVTQHPMIGNTPIRFTLLSPGQKPVQVTADIPGFWVNSYPDVRKDMRAQYPKHPWPDDPTTADPTLRAKPRQK
ncbi:ATP-dependent helicase HrpB [Marivivens niveibacter]|uniref:ATP-dependent helicase HrpB n=1 Tax=Marivivens niveibacter TaxID=1930667 RepID=A0A251WXM3_9RHOB|nr:ATP-dependent helicase HrpB [Marivivens niveibacter]OUD08868.1 ATP-dependent helicase HrpB [Marivivens niveibacter]